MLNVHHATIARDGKKGHPKSLGASLFKFLPENTTPEPRKEPKPPSKLIAFFQTDRLLYRWVDPLSVVIIGVGINYYDPVFGRGIIFAGLALRIIFAGLALRIIEECIWEKGIDALLDQYDGLITAELQNEALQNLRRGNPKEGVNTPGVAPQPPPKGIVEDLREQGAHCKAEAEAREERRRREALAAAETAARNAQTAAEKAQEAAARAEREAAERAQQEGPTHTHTQETVIINTTETIQETIIIAAENTEREVLIVEAKGGSGRLVIPGPIPEGMTEREWLVSRLLYDGSYSFTPEEQAAILVAHDRRQLTGDTAPILLKPCVMPELPAPLGEDEPDEAA